MIQTNANGVYKTFFRISQPGKVVNQNNVSVAWCASRDIEFV